MPGRLGIAERSTAPLWRDELGTAPPYPIGPTSFSLPTTPAPKSPATSRSAGRCPERVLDLFTEFRNRTNGVPTEHGAGLLGALAYHGLDGIGALEKDEMRAWSCAGVLGPTSSGRQILDYCESDVAALARLLPAMLPKIDLPRALLRGRYMAAVARMERNGVPIDVRTLELLKQQLVEDTGSAHRGD